MAGFHKNLDDAYAAGRADAAKPGDGSLDATTVLSGFLSGGLTTLVAGAALRHYNPPRDVTEKAAYDKGWKDQRVNQRESG